MISKSELIEKYLSDVTTEERLDNDRRPVALYGTGNGADKIIDLMALHGRAPDAVFASSGFVRDRTFHGIPVESEEAVVARLGTDLQIFMCFGSDREEVIGNAKRLDFLYDFSLPDVPLYGGGLFNKSYVVENIDRIYEVREMLADEESKALFDDSVMYRLTGRIKYLSRTEDVEKTYKTLFGGKNVGRIIDCGAYRGDSARCFAKVFPDAAEIVAVEADPGTYKKLCDEAGRISSEFNITVTPKNFAVSDVCGKVTYSGSSSRGAGVEGKNRRSKTTTVVRATIDSFADRADLIKLDVEGDEARSLRGAENLLGKCAPSLAVALYHRTEDLLSLPLMIRDISGEYKNMKYYLRRPPCIPCWDLTLFAVKD